MIRVYSSSVTKKLALRFILDNIDYRKKCQYLQEIIAMGRIDNQWRLALTTFFDTPMTGGSLKKFSRN
ncbi:MAG: hypothetical protein ABIT05_05055 [Chitinophagaceae bacterium]